MSDAWERARVAASGAGVELRPLTSLGDARRILEVMARTWGEQDLMPAEMLRALAYSGNVPDGAFDGDELVGYVLGWAAVDPDDGLHLHSHMLAARPGRRGRGVGYALKLAQRARCLDQGIDLARWTFDPLVSRNAWFNIGKLRATCDRFLPDFYGEMGDDINRGEQSDRLLIRWDLGAIDRDLPAAAGVEVLGREGDPNGSPRPRVGGSPEPGAPALVRIPRAYHAVREADARLADEWRAAAGQAFAACFEAGQTVTGFTPDGTYVLE